MFLTQSEEAWPGCNLKSQSAQKGEAWGYKETKILTDTPENICLEDQGQLVWKAKKQLGFP
jgi:hypothetical protein